MTHDDYHVTYTYVDNNMKGRDINAVLFHLIAFT